MGSLLSSLPPLCRKWPEVLRSPKVEWTNLWSYKVHFQHREKGFSPLVEEFWIGRSTWCCTRPLWQLGLDRRRCWPSMLVRAKEWLSLKTHREVLIRGTPRVVSPSYWNWRGPAIWRSWALRTFFSCFPWRSSLFLFWWCWRRENVPRCMSRVRFPHCKGNLPNAPWTWQLSCPLCCHRRWAQWSFFPTQGFCPWHLWNQHYLVLSTPFLSCKGAFGGLTPAFVRSATAISARIFSLDMAKGVHSVKRPLGPLPSRATLPSFFFSWKGFLEDLAAGSSFLDLLRLSVYNSSSYLYRSLRSLGTHWESLDDLGGQPSWRLCPRADLWQWGTTSLFRRHHLPVQVPCWTFLCSLVEVRSFLEQWLKGMPPSLVASLKRCSGLWTRRRGRSMSRWSFSVSSWTT